VNEALLYQGVHNYQAGQRDGTHNTKTLAEVSGAGRKIWKQKGTGRARIGSIRSPLWRHGCSVHGPVTRAYSYHLPKKMLLGAIRSALTARLADGALKVVKDLDLETNKTRDFVKILKSLGMEKKVLIVDNGDNDNLRLSSRNVPGVTLLSGGQIHPYHLLGHENVLFTEPALVKCCEVLK
jgi:large subunit ribosomal protein L4